MLNVKKCMCWCLSITRFHTASKIRLFELCAHLHSCTLYIAGTCRGDKVAGGVKLTHSTLVSDEFRNEVKCTSLIFVCLQARTVSNLLCLFSHVLKNWNTKKSNISKCVHLRATGLENTCLWKIGHRATCILYGKHNAIIINVIARSLILQPFRLEGEYWSMHLATGRPAVYKLFDAEARPETTKLPVLVFISYRNTPLKRT